MTKAPSCLHHAEAILIRIILCGLRRLSPTQASNLGGAVARTIGPILPVSKVADANLRRALPSLTPIKRRRIIRAVWDNLGRTAAEFPHLGDLQEGTTSGPGWQVSGASTLTQLADRNEPVIFVSGHIGNWEILPLAVARYGLPFASFYRAAGNPLVDTIIRQLRNNAIGSAVPNFAKGAKGARHALRHIAKGGNLGVLADQKMNDGIEARLFGLPAMTASATAVFALRHNCPVVTGYVKRIAPARFEVIVDAPILPQATGDRTKDILNLTQEINDRIETAIRSDPGAWLWLHRRWPRA